MLKLILAVYQVQPLSIFDFFSSAFKVMFKPETLLGNTNIWLSLFTPRFLSVRSCWPGKCIQLIQNWVNLSKLKPTLLRSMACQNNGCCSPSYRNLRWVSVYMWDDTPDPDHSKWSADHGCPDLPIFRSPFFRQLRGATMYSFGQSCSLSRVQVMLCIYILRQKWETRHDWF